VFVITDIDLLLKGDCQRYQLFKYCQRLSAFVSYCQRCT